MNDPCFCDGDEVQFTPLDPTYKIVLMGSDGAGKSTLLDKLKSSTKDCVHNLSDDAAYLTVQREEELVFIKDYPENKSETYMKRYFEDVDAALLVFDVTNRDSFNEIPEWFKTLISLTGKMVPTLLIGNKSESGQKAIPDHEIMAYTYELGNRTACKIPYFETSADKGVNIENLIDNLCLMITCKKKGHCAQRVAYQRRYCGILHFNPYP